MFYKEEKLYIYDKNSKIIVKITNITPYGAFCRTEKADGLIHISEFSDYFVRDIKYFVNIGDNAEVEVLNFDPVKKQLKLSYKNYHPELLKKDIENIAETKTSEKLPNLEKSLNTNYLLKKEK